MEDRVLCEVNCSLVHARVSDDGSISLLRATPWSAEAFPDIRLNVDQDQKIQDSSDRDGEADGADDLDSRKSVYSNVNEFWRETLDASKQLLADSLLRHRGRLAQKGLRAQQIAWHVRQQRLAALVGDREVQVFKLEAFKPTSSSKIGRAQPSNALLHAEQRNVHSLKFRPHNTEHLAVSGNNAICLWDLSQTDTSSQRPLCRVLKPDVAAQLNSLSWSPCGAFLAAGHQNTGGFSLWDVASGDSTIVRSGLLSKTVLAWSPNASYLFTASPDGSFEIWETDNWTHNSWSSPNKGAIVNAKWVPDSKTLLLAYAAGQVVALMLIGEPPSLNAQLLPVNMPELQSFRHDLEGGFVSAMDCDPSMQRLALACGGATSKKVLLYSTVTRPVFAAKFIGEAVLDADGSIPTVRFHQAFSKGALLAVATSSSIRTIPMLFESGFGE